MASIFHRLVLKFLIGGIISILPASQVALADTEPTPLAAAKARFATAYKTHNTALLRFSPLELTGGTTLTLVSPEIWSPLTRSLSHSIEELHMHFTKLFGAIPPLTTAIRLMDEESFFQYTGAPRWTNAMYYKGDIIIPLSLNEPLDYENLRRSVRHEYAHAVIHSLSKGRCPGWFDEGLAQWVEGSENPALRPALLEWLELHPPISFSRLQGGFIKLATPLVPIAYAQSLFATHAIIHTFGTTDIKNYFQALRSGTSKKLAFQKSFGISEKGFEEGVRKGLTLWAEQ